MKVGDLKHRVDLKITINIKETLEDGYVVLKEKGSGAEGWGFGYENAFNVFAKNYADHIDETRRRKK